MLFRSVSAAMILVMLVSTVAPAQILMPGHPRDPFRNAPKQQSTAVAADSVDAATVHMAVGLDEPINPDEYIIGPGDQFVMLVRQAGTEVPLRVLPEGTVVVPNAGVVRAAGLTITEFRAELARQLGTFYRGSNLIIELVIPRTFVVYVLGHIRYPGPVQVSAPFRLDTVVKTVGGVLGLGSEREIEVREEGKETKLYDLVRFHRLGDHTQNPMLHEGQTVFVPVRGASVTISGEIWRGDRYEIVPGETMVDIINLAGGFTTNAWRERLVLERVNDLGDVTITEMPESQAAQTVLDDRDVIIVPDHRSFPGVDFVRVQGGGGRDGRIYLGEGETLESFLPRFIRLRNDFDLSHSTIERRQPDGSVRFIPVDLESLVVGDSTASVPLKSGDVINIPPLDDVVFVSGEVVAPGEIDFQRGLPVGRYVAMAGGPNSSGSVDKIEIYDNRGNTRKGNRDSVVYRGETILVKRRTGVVLGGLFLGFVSLTSLFLSVYAVVESRN